MLRSPIKYFGGKGYVVRWLLQHVPKHEKYLEVFGGGASLLFAKPKAQFEVYNDVDENLFVFFSVLKDPQKFKEFLRLAWLTPYSRKEFAFLKEKILKNDFKNDVEKAHAVWYVSRTCFAGKIESLSFGFSTTAMSSGMSRDVAGYLSSLKSLHLIHERFKSVQLECLDFRECMKKYVPLCKYEDTFIYVDPPYVPSTRKAGGYTHELTEEDHHELVELLIRYENRAKFMLSGYPNEIYEKLEKRGWTKIVKKVGCAAIGRVRNSKFLGNGSILNSAEGIRKEAIWINYEIQSRLF